METTSLSNCSYICKSLPNSKKNQLSSPKMSQEIVPVSPWDVFVDMDPIVSEDSNQFTAYHEDSEVQHVWEPYDSERLPKTLASGIERFLHVANLVESEEPRIAFLCRHYTFEEAHRIDRSSTGRGVRQFKNSLLRMLEKDDDITRRRRQKMSDIGELKRVYYSQREKLINTRRIASVLYEIIKKIDTSIQLDQDEETGELLDMVTLMDETTHQKNSDVASVDRKAELIVQESKSLENGDGSVQSNHLTQVEINDAIYKKEVQIKNEIEDNVGPIFKVPSSLYEDKYLEIQEKLNKAEKKIEAMDLKFKDVDFWTSMMQNLFPDQVPPSLKANQTEKNKHDKLSL